MDTYVLQPMSSRVAQASVPVCASSCRRPPATLSISRLAAVTRTRPRPTKVSFYHFVTVLEKMPNRTAPRVQEKHGSMWQPPSFWREASRMGGAG